MNPISSVWNFLLSLLGGLLAFFYQIIPSYGLAIILLTLAIGVLLFPLTLKQTRSMTAMQEIQPEVKRLQKELKGDREELNKQLMELYKERGVNPAAGCLPLVLQMPIWFALFSVLRTGSGIPEDSDLWAVVEPAKDLLERMREAGDVVVNGVFSDSQGAVDAVEKVFEPVRFLGVNLLISPAEAFGIGVVFFVPYAILLVVIIAAGYYQQVQMTRRRKTNGQEQQSSQMAGMQNAMKIMPLFFGFISWNLPTGLDLYFAISNLFRIGQQWLILRLHPGGGPTEKGVEKSPKDPEGDDAKPQGPSPNASKKKSRRKRK